MASLKAKYVLEVEFADGTRKVLLPRVNKYKHSDPETSSTTWSLGVVPNHQYSGVREQTIELAGVSGLADRFETEGETSVARADMSGPALFRVFWDFVEEYKRAAYDAQRNVIAPPKAIFHALWERKSMYVEIGPRSFIRDVRSSKFMYEWDLTLKTYGYVADEPKTGFAAVLSDAVDVANTVTTAINKANIAISKAVEFIEDVRTQLDSFRQPLRAVANFGNQLSRLGQATDALSRWPQAFVQDFWYALFEVTIGIFDFWASLPFAPRQEARNAMLEVLGPLSEAKVASVTALGFNGIKTPKFTSSYENKQGFAGSSDHRLASRQSALTITNSIPGKILVKSGSLVTTYTVQVGDTLLSIANKMLGDKSKWGEIAALNNMVSPYVLDDGSPIQAGAVLYVPVAAGAPLIGPTSKNLYGTDLLIEDGDLVVSGTDDVAVATGNANLRQALTTRLLTKKGSNRVFPQFGLTNIIGEATTEDTAAEVSLDVSTQLLREDRIKKIVDLEVQSRGSVVSVSARVQPVSGSEFNIDNIPVMVG